MTTQYDIFQDVATVLNDETYKRWTPVKLNSDLNRSLRRLVQLKPTAHTGIVSLALVAGVRQALSDPTHNQIVSVISNTASGVPITPIDREILDATLPGWQSVSVVPATTDVQHVIFDRNEPSDYMVYPSNDGGGSIDVLMSLIPSELANGGTPTDASTFTATIPVGDIYREVLVDLTIAHALSADLAQPGTAQRAMAHLNSAREALGLKRVYEKTEAPRDAHKLEGNL